MPEFIMDKQGLVNGRTFDDLPPLVQGYIEAMFFTETCSGIFMTEWNKPENQEAVKEADGSIPTDSGFDDIYPESLRQIIADCGAFHVKARNLLSRAYGHKFPAHTIGDGSLSDSYRPEWQYDAHAAGRDFWFTRNGCGVGFWDRGLGEIGDKLSEIASAFGEVYVAFGEAVSGEDSPTGYGFVFAE